MTKHILFVALVLCTRSAQAGSWENNDSVVASHENARERALAYCEEHDSETLTVIENDQTISVVCKDTPDTLTTFLL